MGKSVITQFALKIRNFGRGLIHSVVFHFNATGLWSFSSHIPRLEKGEHLFTILLHPCSFNPREWMLVNFFWHL